MGDPPTAAQTFSARRLGVLQSGGYGYEIFSKWQSCNRGPIYGSFHN